MLMTPKPKIERRKVPRRNAAMETVLVHENGVAREAGVIRDISVAGAKLAIASTGTLPDSAYILIPEQHQIEQCRIVWRSEHEVGLAFAAEPQQDPKDRPQD